MENVTIKAISPYGFQIEGEEGWINYDKKYTGQKLEKGKHEGSSLSIERNEKGFVTNIAVAPTMQVDDRTESIIRQVAIKAACACLTLDAHANDEAYDDAKQRIFSLAADIEKWIKR